MMGSKAAQKYYNKMSEKDRKRVDKALDGRGETIKLKNVKDKMFEKKIEHYRMICRLEKGEVYVEHLIPRTQLKYRKYGVHN